jgi:integrase
VADVPSDGASARRKGGLKPVREGVWRIDVELPRAPGERRRRVSRTIVGSQDEAGAALEDLVGRVHELAPKAPPAKRTSTGAKARRTQRSGAITRLGIDRWLVGVEGPPDAVSGQRRRYTRTVRGDREQAEVTLAALKLALDGGAVPIATRAKTVRAACDLYLSEARTESQTLRTDSSACRRICATVLPGGTLFGQLPLSKVDWKLIEQTFAKWEGAIEPSTRARYASTLSKVFEHAKRTGWMRSNPTSDARRPKVPSHRPVVPATVEVREALRLAKSQDFVLYAYVIGMATIGCRRSELLAITVADLDLDQGVVTIRASIADGGPGRGTYRKTTKRDDWRDVPLTAQMIDVFIELLARRRDVLKQFGKDKLDPDGCVFSDEMNGARWMRPDSTTQRWLAARGSSKVTFAMLRPYVATQLLDVTNGDYRTVASITGNSEETLRRWYDAGPNLQKKRAVVEMARL